MEDPSAHRAHEVRAAEALAVLVGRDPRLMDVIRRFPTIAPSEATVLITGETGTGKELAARAIHYLGPRAPLPFVPVNCGALPDALLESELFGHERGAFTDARAPRTGLVHEAQGGTLCLDEVDSLSPRAQVVLLRLLQDRTYRPVGSSRQHRGDVRFIAITNARLSDRVAAGAFRADLYYRLSILTVDLPPLRERKNDVPLLAAHFLGLYTHRSAIPTLSPAAEGALMAYDWPGNVRELENAIVRAVHNCGGGVVQAEDLALPVGAVPEAASEDSFTSQKRRAIESFERQYLLALMQRTAGNITHAAQAAGKDRRDLGRLLKKYGVDARVFAGGIAPRTDRGLRPAS